jgi:hypothetical protein
MKIIDAKDADDFENVVQIPTTGRNDSEEAVSVHQFITDVQKVVKYFTLCFIKNEIVESVPKGRSGEMV